jgi:hypothetical protein
MKNNDPSPVKKLPSFGSVNLPFETSGCKLSFDDDDDGSNKSRVTRKKRRRRTTKLFHDQSIFLCSG